MQTGTELGNIVMTLSLLSSSFSLSFVSPQVPWVCPAFPDLCHLHLFRFFLPCSSHDQCCQLWSELAGCGPNSDFFWENWSELVTKSLIFTKIGLINDQLRGWEFNIHPWHKRWVSSGEQSCESFEQKVWFEQFFPFKKIESNFIIGSVSWPLTSFIIVFCFILFHSYLILMGWVWALTILWVGVWCWPIYI